MNTPSYRRLSGTATAVILALVLVPTLAAAQDSRGSAQPGRTSAERMGPRQALALTPDQEKALEEFRKARGEEGRAFRDEMMKVREEMRGLAKDPQANRAKIEALIDRTAKLRADREKAALRTREERNRIFTPEQLEKLKAWRGRLADRRGLAAWRGRAAFGPMGFRGPGRFGGQRPAPGRMARLRALRHRALLRRRHW
jgi:Spy/CpxP family protein refolding chaperone